MMLRAVAASAVMIGVALAPGTGAGADPGDGASLSSDGTFRIAESVEQAAGGSGDGGGGGGGGSGVSCWRRVDEDMGEEVMQHVFQREGTLMQTGTPFINRCREWLIEPQGTIGLYHASNLALFYDPSYYVFWEGADVPSGTPLEVPLLQQLWEAEIEGQLGGPEPVVTPPVGEPVIVDHFTFASVENPQEVVDGENCMPEAGLCVTIHAEPTLTFDPGDGSDPIECEPEGTAFDPDGPAPAAQAEGGCAHAYGERSAAGFPGRVEVVWEVEWTSTGNGGIGAAFDPLVLPEGDEPNALRVVDESQAVVNNIAGGGEQ